MCGLNKEKLELAIIGCGAAAELVHLPAAASSEKVSVTVLVDKNLPRAQALARQFDIPYVADDYTTVLGKAQGAVVALPHHLHAPVGLELLAHGIHVLVEKPMALKGRDCDRMISVAERVGLVLAVGLVRRFYAAMQFVKGVLEDGILGSITSFDVREGNIYDWPVVSDFVFRKELAGGGVLVDTGAHTLDVLLWWLGDYESVEYYDDAMGGVEADCELHLRLQSGVTGVVELSRTRNLRNTFIIRGERGTLEVGIDVNPPVHLRIKNQEIVLAGRAIWDGVAEDTFLAVCRRQLEDFADAILGRREPFILGQEGKRSVELIEACYASRRPLRLPWMFPESSGEGVLP